MQKRAVIIIPTYNEIGNIKRLLKAITEQRQRIRNYSLHILVVDDSSPDGTAGAVRKLSLQNPNIHLLDKGKKQGLGMAYIRGFQYAIHELRADVVFEMDADFSHNPSDIPRLLTEIDQGSDFVIGSRYISNGSIPKNWPWLRKMNSKWGNIFARRLAGLHGIQDCTSGYRAIKTKSLRKIDLNSISPKGYAFQISLLFLAVQAKSKVSEIPIHFTDRTAGQSKLKVSDIVEFIFQTFQLRLKRTPKIVSRILISLFVLAPGGIFSIVISHAFLTLYTFLSISIVSISLFTICYGVMSTVLMLYAWESGEALDQIKKTKDFLPAKYSFTALIPARHEENVIEQTIIALANLNYPNYLHEVLIICREDDKTTIIVANHTIARLNAKNIRVVVFDDASINKPHALNIGLRHAKNDIVVVFDAEDEPHKDIYNVANTLYQKEAIDVLQSGIQLINFRSRWFSTLNVLEYFFWFKSTLHFFSDNQAIPLGGNSVFFKRQLLKQIKGWDESCLTEDADIGIRLSHINAQIKVFYDQTYVTQEETPLSINSFIKQRTRWNQGFIQILFKREWLHMRTIKQRFLSGYVLVSPLIQALSFIFVPISVYITFVVKLPVIIVLLAFLPLYIQFFQVLTYMIGFFLFLRTYKLKYPLLLIPLRILLTFYFFQLLLGISALRAVTRSILRNDAWEKTMHNNAHREQIFSKVQTALS